MYIQKITSALTNALGYIPGSQTFASFGRIPYDVVKNAISSIGDGFGKIAYGAYNSLGKHSFTNAGTVGAVAAAIAVVGLGIYLANKRNHHHHSLESLFGPKFPLDDNDKKFIQDECKVNKEFAKEFQKLVDHLHSVRSKFLKNPDGNVHKIMGEYVKANILLQNCNTLIGDDIQKQMRFLEVGNHMIDSCIVANSQIHSDGLIIGLMDHQGFDTNSPAMIAFDRTFAPKNAVVDQRMTEIRDIEQQIQTVSSKKHKDLLIEKKKHLEENLMHFKRHGTNGVFEKVSWENITTDKATRKFSFKTENGDERTTQVELDLSSLGKEFDYDQYKKLIEAIATFEQKTEAFFPLIAKEKTLTYDKLNKAHQNLVEKEIKAKDKFDKYELHKQVDRFALLKSALDKLDFLDKDQKDSFVQIATTFSWNINREINLARIQLGWPAKSK